MKKAARVPKSQRDCRTFQRTDGLAEIGNCHREATFGDLNSEGFARGHGFWQLVPADA